MGTDFASVFTIVYWFLNLFRQYDIYMFFLNVINVMNIYYYPSIDASDIV